MKIDNYMSQADRCELFGALIDVVEDWLESKGITVANIPNDEREDEDSAIIYGSDYDELADKFATVLGIDRDDMSEFAYAGKIPETLTVGMLKEAFSGRNLPAIKDIVDGKSDDCKLTNLANLDDYVACKLWSKEDIAEVLREHNYEASEHNIAAVANSGLLKQLEDCLDEEWDVIGSVVEEVMSRIEEREDL